MLLRTGEGICEDPAGLGTKKVPKRIDIAYSFCLWGNISREHRLASLNGLTYGMTLKNWWCPSGLNLANCKLGERDKTFGVSKVELCEV